jgi:hypothetical protein
VCTPIHIVFESYFWCSATTIYWQNIHQALFFFYFDILISLSIYLSIYIIVTDTGAVDIDRYVHWSSADGSDVDIRTTPAYPGVLGVGTIASGTTLQFTHVETVQHDGHTITFYCLTDGRGWLHDFNCDDPSTPLATVTTPPTKSCVPRWAYFIPVIGILLRITQAIAGPF